MNAYRNIDALGIYLTGAASEGGAQVDPSASLGGYRSSTEARLVGGLVGNSTVPPIVILRGYQLGAGIINGYIDRVQYDDGSYVVIANGETKLLESATGGVRVYRADAGSLSGKMPITWLPPYNDAVGMDNLTNSQRISGLDTYRALMLRAHGEYGVLDVYPYLTQGTPVRSDVAALPAAGAGSITTTGSLEDWADSGFAQVRTLTGALREIVYYSSRTDTTLSVVSRGLLGTVAAAGTLADTVHVTSGIRIGLEAPAVDGSIQTIADETTAPVGITWSTALSEDLKITSIDLNKNYGLWIHRHFPAGGAVAVEMANSFVISFYAA